MKVLVKHVFLIFFKNFFIMFLKSLVNLLFLMMHPLLCKVKGSYFFLVFQLLYSSSMLTLIQG